ncbi:hypothetical protein [Dactylosporangium darangshiense]|uniref:Lipoprotein n=1 Tax=Dactylosporangium darangshiense TaxID=579108 RepID=A0ABP8DN98_9ACTN
MKHIKVLLTIALATGTVVGLSGCETEFSTSGTPAAGRALSTSSSASAKPSKSALPPADALKKAVQELDNTAYTFAIKQGELTGGGRIDRASKKAMMQMGGDVSTSLHISVAYTIIAPDLWIKADFGDDLNKEWGLDPTTWLLVDKSKVDSTAALPVDDSGAPELGVTELFKDGLGEVQRTDATHFTGTVDVTVANSVLAPSDDVVTKAGARAKAVPFTATVDEEGRLTKFVIDGGSIAADLAMELTFSGFGAIPPVTAPTNAVAAPDSVYKLFN